MSNYKVEEDFEYNGLRCVVALMSMGHRCGYVGITKEHPLYGKDYDNNCPELLKSKVEDEPIGERGIVPFLKTNGTDYMSPECYFDVHGGITYADGGDNSKYPVESNLWWFGFDCAHCDDENDYDAVLKYGLMTQEDYNYLTQRELKYSTYGVIRTKEYVKSQCESFADQLNMIKGE